MDLLNASYVNDEQNSWFQNFMFKKKLFWVAASLLPLQRILGTLKVFLEFKLVDTKKQP